MLLWSHRIECGIATTLDESCNLPKCNEKTWQSNFWLWFRTQYKSKMYQVNRSKRQCTSASRSFRSSQGLLRILASTWRRCSCWYISQETSWLSGKGWKFQPGTVSIRVRFIFLSFHLNKSFQSQFQRNAQNGKQIRNNRRKIKNKVATPSFSLALL